jgi:hypothetical protein
VGAAWGGGCWRGRKEGQRPLRCWFSAMGEAVAHSLPLSLRAKHSLPRSLRELHEKVIRKIDAHRQGAEDLLREPRAAVPRIEQEIILQREETARHARQQRLSVFNNPTGDDSELRELQLEIAATRDKITRAEFERQIEAVRCRSVAAENGLLRASLARVRTETDELQLVVSQLKSSQHKRPPPPWLARDVSSLVTLQHTSGQWSIRQQSIQDGWARAAALSATSQPNAPSESVRFESRHSQTDGASSLEGSRSHKRSAMSVVRAFHSTTAGCDADRAGARAASAEAHRSSIDSSMASSPRPQTALSRVAEMRGSGGVVGSGGLLAG